MYCLQWKIYYLWEDTYNFNNSSEKRLDQRRFFNWQAWKKYKNCLHKEADQWFWHFETNHSLNQQNVESKKIGEIVINKLKKLDDVSYIRFASVYKDFKNLSYFEDELNDLSKK